MKATATINGKLSLVNFSDSKKTVYFIELSIGDVRQYATRTTKRASSLKIENLKEITHAEYIVFDRLIDGVCEKNMLREKLNRANTLLAGTPINQYLSSVWSLPYYNHFTCVRFVANALLEATNDTGLAEILSKFESKASNGNPHRGALNNYIDTNFKDFKSAQIVKDAVELAVLNIKK